MTLKEPLDSRLRRWAGACAVGGMLTMAAVPFVVLFPEPPAFGPGAVAIAVTVAILATVGSAFGGSALGRRRLLVWAAILLGVTIGSIVTNILLMRTFTPPLPTAGLLPRLFGLYGEEIDDAMLYEGWVELWLALALVSALVVVLRQAGRPRRPSTAAASPWEVAAPAPASPPWNGSTILLWLLGVGLLAGAIWDGHRTEDFLSRAVHVSGAIAEARSHPRIRFTTAEGADIVFTQNGFVSRPLGTAVPVAYLTEDPAGSARADTFWVNWSNLLGLLWIGFGFTLFPFYGMRATLRGGRW